MTVRRREGPQIPSTDPRVGGAGVSGHVRAPLGARHAGGGRVGCPQSSHLDR